MLNGLWTINTLIDDNPRDTVSVFYEGTIMGGNSNYFFEGDYYVVEQGRIAGKIVSRHYNGKMDPIFNNAEEVSIAFDANIMAKREMRGVATEIESLMTFPL